MVFSGFGLESNHSSITNVPYASRILTLLLVTHPRGGKSVLLFRYQHGGKPVADCAHGPDSPV